MALTKIDILNLGRGSLNSSAGTVRVFTSNNVPSVWSNTVTYNQYNVVEYGTTVYRSKIPANLGNQPDISPNQWEVLYHNLTDGDVVFVVNGSSSDMRQRISGVWVKLSTGLVGTVVNSMFHWDGTAFTENLGLLLDGYEIRGFDDNVNDSAKAANVILGASNKTAGTGDGGDLVLRGGNSTGGTKGKVRFGGNSTVFDTHRTSDPPVASSETGEIYYNTTTNKFRYYNGVLWQDIGTGSGAGENLPLSGFIDSPYKFMTYSIFSVHLTENIDIPLTTATFTGEQYNFTAGQVLRTLDLVDSGFPGPLREATVTLYFGANEDTNMLCQLSRDGGVTWETVTLTENTNTKEYSGRLVFDPATEQIPENIRLRLTASMTCNLLGFSVMYGEFISQVALNVAAAIPIVGTPAQVAIGMATHSSLQAAINDTTTGGKILLIASITENINVNKEGLIICGTGKGAKLNGNLTLNANYCTVREIYFNGALVDNGENNIIDIVWDL